MAVSEGLAESSSRDRDRTDLVAYWSVPLLDGVHTVEFEHGTTSGKRVLRVDGKEIIRREWMFKLVGDEHFLLGAQGAKCELRVDPLPFFAFSYSLVVDGTPLEKFTEKQSQSTRTWVTMAEGKRYRIIFEKQTLNVWVNGQSVDSESSFVDDGTEMRFQLDENVEAVIKATTTDRKQGVVHELYVDDKYIEEDKFTQ